MQYNQQYLSNALSELINKYYYADGGEVNSQDDQNYADDLARLKRAYENSNFGPNDSMIASTIRHPAEAVRRAGDWLQEKERILSGRPYEDDFTPEDQALAGLDIAGLAETGSMPFAPASAGGTLGTFIGPKSRNWDKVAAELAAKKLDEGADPAEVWREHLIGRMPDKTLFSEISDYPASFKGVGSFGDVVMNRLDALQNAGKKTIDDPMNVADIFTHRDLAESYPELFPSTEVRFLSKDDKSKGSMQVMDDGTNILKMPYDATRDKTSTMLHELQHAIQRDEGWTRGGSPGQFVPELIDMQDAAYEKIKSLNSDMAFISKQLDKVKESKFDMRPELYEKKLNNLKNKYDELMNERDSHVTNAQLDIPSEAFKRYKNLAGEAQARATQDRLDMDMAQRRENYPLAGGKLSDIPLEELIYKYEGNGPSLDVHGYGTAKKIADVLNTKYGKDIDADISGNDRGLTLNKLIVDADKRNQGIGSNFLKDLTQYADEESLPMQLTAAGDFGGNKARQVSLYKKYGFLENKGKNKDYSISENMYRTPNDLSELSKYKDYVGEHSAPLGDSGAPLHDLTANNNAIYPSDVYSSQANQYYGSGEPEDAQLFAMAQRLKDKPNEKVTIYRAVPKMQSNSEKAAQLEKDLANYMKRGRMPSNSDFNNKSDWYEWASNERDRLASLPEETLDPLSINHGDWVALDKKYAKEHGESALGGNYKILSKKVPARQLFTNGDSIREWGWDSRYAEGGSVKDLHDKYYDGYVEPKYAYRDNMTNKAKGYFGELKRYPSDDYIMSEFSIGIPMNVEAGPLVPAKAPLSPFENYIDVPSIVPTLNRDDIDAVLNEKITPSVSDKATEHAYKRMFEGRRPFASDAEEVVAYPSDSAAERLYNRTMAHFDDLIAKKFADGGSVSEFEDPAHERLYRRAMAHFDNLVNA